jgi:hypothetical protein
MVWRCDVRFEKVGTTEMTQFLSLKQLRDSVWPLAVSRKLATDMTGVSLPILHFQSSSSMHPYQVRFLLYYSVSDTNTKPPSITRSYALVDLSLYSGELVKAQAILPVDEPKSLIGESVRSDILELPANERRMLQDLFFTRCEEAAQVYASGEVSADQSTHLADLLDLYDSLSEPPLHEDYESCGQAFFSWLREHAMTDKGK